MLDFHILGLISCEKNSDAKGKLLFSSSPPLSLFFLLRSPFLLLYIFYFLVLLYSSMEEWVLASSRLIGCCAFGLDLNEISCLYTYDSLLFLFFQRVNWMHDLVHIYILVCIYVHIFGLMNMGMNARIEGIRNLDSNFYDDNCSDA